MSQVIQGAQVVTDPREAVHLLQGDEHIAVDLETSGLSPYRDKAAVVTMYGDQTNTLAILHVRGDIPSEVRELLEDPHKTQTYHNGVAFDIPFLLQNGVDPTKAKGVFDTLVGETVVVGSSRRDVRVSLQATINRRLGITLSKEVEHSWMNPVLTPRQLEYCAEDIVHLHALRRSQEEKARATSQVRALELEMAIVPAVAQMSFNGLPISLDRLDYMLDKAQFEASEARAELQGKIGAINFNSPVQVKRALHQWGLEVGSTQADYLEEVVAGGPEGALASGIIGYRDLPDNVRLVAAESALEMLTQIMSVRQADKRKAMYGDTWRAQHVTNQMIHSRFWQCGTDTGRFSSTDPNLQQWPRDLRPAIGHKEGWKIVSSDYGQIEVVVAAYLAKDPVLLKLIESGGDIHRLVAAQVFGISPDSVTSYQRKLAKAMSFCLLFGGGAKTLVTYARRYGAVIDLKTGQEITTAFFNRFPGIKATREKAYTLANSGRNLVQITLPSGLKRNLVGNKIAPTVILNTTVQGSAAAGMKYAILECKRRGLIKYIGATVHDELTGCVPSAEAEDFSVELQDAMLTGMANIVKCKVGVDAVIGDHWTD